MRAKSKISVAILLVVVVNNLECVSCTVLGYGQYPVPQQQQTTQGHSQLATVGVSQFQPQTRIQTVGGNEAQYLYNGGFSSSSPYYPNQQNQYVLQQYQNPTVISTTPQPQYSTRVNPFSHPNAINVQVVPRGQSQIYNVQQGPHPQQDQKNVYRVQQQPQFLSTPIPTAIPQSQYPQNNQQTITKVTYLSSVATVNPASNKRRQRIRVKPTQSSSSPLNNSPVQFYNLQQPNSQIQYYQRPEVDLPIQVSSPSPISFASTPAPPPVIGSQARFQNVHNTPQTITHSQSSPAFHGNFQSINQQLGFSQGTASPFLNNVNIQYQNQQSPSSSGSGSLGVSRSRKTSHASQFSATNPIVGTNTLVLGPHGGVKHYDPNQYNKFIKNQQDQDLAVGGGNPIFAGNNAQTFEPLNSNSIASHETQPPQTPLQITPSQPEILNLQFQEQNSIANVPQGPQPESIPIQNIPQYAPQYAPQFPQSPNVQHQGFQPNNFLQQFQQSEFTGQPQNPQFGQPLNFGQQLPFGPQQQPGQNPFLQFPPGQFPPGQPGPHGQGPPPLGFEPENGFNPNFLQSFPEPPYESEFSNEPPLTPKDEIELAAYNSKLRKNSHRRLFNPNEAAIQPLPLISQGTEDVAIQTTPPTAQVGEAAREECAYNTITRSYEGNDCVEIR